MQSKERKEHILILNKNVFDQSVVSSLCFLLFYVLIFPSPQINTLELTFPCLFYDPETHY